MSYFKDINVVNLDGLIIGSENIYAHKKDKPNNIINIEYETLKEHSVLTLEYFERLCVEKNLHIVFQNIERAIVPDKYVALWKELMINAIYLHDIGKINLGFQDKKMKNTVDGEYDKYESEHSSISSIVYMSIFLNKLKDIESNMSDDEYYKTLFFIFLNSYIISKHHGSLGDDALSGSKIMEYIKKWLISFRDNISLLNEDAFSKLEVLENMDEDSINDIFSNICSLFNHNELIVAYIYGKLLFSAIVSADFYATYEYMNNSKVKSFGVLSKNDKENYIKTFEQDNVVKSIRCYAKNKVDTYTNINQLRSEMFLESEEQLLRSLYKNIFYVEAPTGAGKTYTSVNLALSLLKNNDDINKLFYVFPFNTLVEQTHKTLSEMLLDNVVVNSITPISKEVFINDDNLSEDCETTKRKEKTDEEAYLDRQFLHYGTVLMSHIGLFNILFGVNKNSNFPLLQICNSVIVLDEIQSYKNEIWKQMIEMIDVYSSILNIKFIIMSATLPKLDLLLDINSSEYVNLITNRDKYFSNPLFKNRVEINYDLMDKDKNNLLDLLKDMCIDYLRDGKKVVIEFIKKNTAIKFYNFLQEGLNYELSSRIKLISGDDSSLEKKKIIKYTKDNKNGMVLVATQVIEAGVDIDMDIGFKDTSLIDNEEQFMGRINRNASPDKKGLVYFFNYDNCEDIYRNDCRKNYSINVKKYRSVLVSKDFGTYYRDVMDFIKSSASKDNDNSYMSFNNSIKNTKYTAIKKNLTLIEDKKSIRLFLNRVVRDLDDNIVIGSDVWSEYKSIVYDNDLGYAEKQNKLYKMQEKVDFFTYQVIVTYKFNKENISYNEEIGNILYIEEGDKYLTEDSSEGKFDRSKILKGDVFDIW